MSNGDAVDAGSTLVLVITEDPECQLGPPRLPFPAGLLRMLSGSTRSGRSLAAALGMPWPWGARRPRVRVRPDGDRLLVRVIGDDRPRLVTAVSLGSGVLPGGVRGPVEAVTRPMGSDSLAEIDLDPARATGSPRDVRVNWEAAVQLGPRPLTTPGGVLRPWMAGGGSSDSDAVYARLVDEKRRSAGGIP